LRIILSTEYNGEIMGDIQNALHQAMQSLQPVHLELVNESFMHSVPPGSESHFKAVIVSDEFASLNAVKRHQAVYRSLGDLMSSIHALALRTRRPNGMPASRRRTRPIAWGAAILTPRQTPDAAVGLC
jgi:BolA protein